MRIFLLGLFIQVIFILAKLPEILEAESVKVSTQTVVSDEIENRILASILALKQKHVSLAEMQSPRAHNYRVEWVLQDPSKPAGKLNARTAVYGEDGYWFSLTFYRGSWQGAARFQPIEFGDLKLWFNYGHGGNTSVIADIATILLHEEEEALRSNLVK